MRSKFKWIATLSLVFIMQICFAQDRTVTGMVTDGAMPIPGANVQVKGTKRSTQTDFDGKFSIKVGVNEILVFSYLGMQSHEVVASSAVINVKLSSSSVELESVVVTALGIKRKWASKCIIFFVRKCCRFTNYFTFNYGGVF